jgi:Ser/Thr protein kinase RdoA (MazF antagonist)
MRVVAIVTILALVFVAFVPGIGLTDASATLVRSAGHAVASFARALRLATLRPNVFAIHWRVTELRPAENVATPFPLYDLDCTWLC